MVIRFILAGMALAAMASGTLAQGFVGGIPAGWTCEGDCGVLGADGDVTLSPTGAAKYGYVVTGEATPTGLSPFDLPGGTTTTGSRLRSFSFSATAGDPLRVDFNFITSDGDTFSDYGWARLLNASDLSQAALLFTARTKPSGSIVPGQDLPSPAATLTPSSVPIIANPVLDTGPTWSALGSDSAECFDLGCGYTGWVQTTFTIAATGNYVLEFGVANWDDTVFQSGLAFDGITVAGAALVPEPETYAQLLAGMGMLLWLARRRRSA